MIDEKGHYNYKHVFMTGHGSEEIKKNKEAFDSRTGTCYTDSRGKEYTYGDLLALTRNEEAAEELFKALSCGPPEEVLESSFSFKKCERCGTWAYVGESLFKKKRHCCKFCTPLRTNGKVALRKDPYCDDRIFTKKKHAAFRPGLTTLVGCNGAGKTTLMLNIEERLKERGTPFLHFDNLGSEGGERSAMGLLQMGLAGHKEEGPVDFLAMQAFSTSEGEKIVSSFARFTKSVLRDLKDTAAYGEFWLLVDALDSGLSVDMTEDIKKYIFEPILKKADDSLRVYIIVSSNSYEMSEGTECFSLEKMDYIPVRNYASFKKAVLSSRRYKEERDNVFEKKSEIAKRDMHILVDRDLFRKWDGSEDISGDAITAELYPYRLVLSFSRKVGGGDVRSRLFKEEDGVWKRARCGLSIDPFSIRSGRPEDTVEEVRDYLIREVFLYERKNKM